jgi:hypothetical protein
MRKSMEHQTPTPLLSSVEPATTGFNGSSFGHPLDMLARTAANTHSPDMNRLHATSTSYNGITPPAQPTLKTSLRIGTSESISTSWTTDLSAIDPIERGWVDLEDAKYFFERYLSIGAY